MPRSFCDMKNRDGVTCDQEAGHDGQHEGSAWGKRLRWGGRSNGATASFDGVRCIRATEKAILVVVEGKQLWIPQSHVHEDSEVYADGHEGTLVITQWIATQKGLV